MEKIKIILISNLIILALPQIFALVAGAEATQGVSASWGISEEYAASCHSQSTLSAW